jgi:ribosomal-protein-alanine N-acetyltransferase
MNFEQLTTPRLTLLKITPEVHKEVFTTMTNDAIMELFGFDEKGLEKEKFRHQNGVATYNRKFLYFILKETTTGKSIGMCGFHTWYTDHDRAEIFYMLYDDSYKRQGIMTEAATAVLQFGFTAMNLHRVEAMTATYNIASQKVMEKFGFVFEGTLREHYLVDGNYEDSIAFSLLKHEFLYNG